MLSRRAFLTGAAAGVAGVLLPTPTAAKVITPEPRWLQVPVRRAVTTGLGAVLDDVDSRLPATGLVSSATYRSTDPVTWVHEATHGVNSLVRLSLPGDAHNAAYCLGGRAAVMREPRPVTVRDSARYVPVALRGKSTYSMYMSQQRAWNNDPLYILDEWSAYTNGAAQYLQDVRAGRQSNSVSDLTYMAHFAIYSLCTAIAVEQAQRRGVLQYDDTQMKAYIQWQWNRMMNLFADGQPFTRMWNPIDYYRIFAVEAPGATLRKWARQYFGPAWVAGVMRASA